MHRGKARAIVLTVVMISFVTTATVAFSGTVAAADTLTVDDDGPSDYDTIQAALDDADEGDTIEVEPGTYEENVVIRDDDIALLGPNRGVPGYADRGTEAVIEGRVHIEGNGTVVDGLEVRNPNLQHVNTQAVTIEGGADDVEVANNIVRDVTISEAAADALPFFQGIEGISMFGVENDAVEDPVVRNNLVTNVTSIDHQRIGGAAGVMVQGNVQGAEVADNVITGIGGGGSPWAQGVVVTGTGNHDVPPASVSITGNDIIDVTAPNSNFDGVGVGIESSGTDYVVGGNDIEANDIGIEVKAAAGETRVESNNIEGNAVGVSNVDDQTLDATGNWWGHASGPGGEDGRVNPAGKEVGKGDDIEGDVAFDPWLRKPADT